ncbi:hypothetical protein IQ247_28195 [Plectonema cf. radiosum LEGE 06105]|uniref:Uncharacterized protein n=1 Tax=Plectonema cf. radiosum LEGE 06105 TaxID=945769 RepID=A0A8J7K430_9CYAN|nr:hypothetical protein [Plectonema radiosum]MBE9216496.1 hypothetical protein [Plectonema cf. radiosum LEGE 06105]
MLPNNPQKISAETYINVPATSNFPTPPVIQPTPYDYLALLPAILTALTPLILGLKKKDKDDEDKE